MTCEEGSYVIHALIESSIIFQQKVKYEVGTNWSWMTKSLTNNNENPPLEICFGVKREENFEKSLSYKKYFPSWSKYWLCKASEKSTWCRHKVVIPHVIDVTAH